MPPPPPLPAARPRGIHEGRVLKVLRDIGPVSRTRIAGITGLSATTITKTVNPMLEDGLLRESDDSSGGLGRPALSLVPVPEAVTVAGVQLGVGRVRLGLSDAAGRMRALTSYAFDPREPAEQVLAGIAEAVQTLLDADEGAPCVGIGLGAPGPVDVSRRRNILAINLGWRDVAISDELEGDLGVPVVVDHNVRSFALGESRYVDHGARSLAYVYVRTGVGFGVAVRGEPFYGGPGSGGESYLGHLRVVPGGRRCSCGSSGCLETLLAEPYLGADLAAIRGAASSPSGSPPAEMMPELHELARSGDARAAALEQSIMTHLGGAIATITNLFTPELVLVGGTLSALPSTALAQLDAETRDRIFPLLRDSLRIETADGSDTALVRGAAAIALEVLYYS